MAPIITSTGQTRSRLPTQWLHNASAKSSAVTAVKHADHDALLQGNPVRWSTHTLAADPNDTVRSRADSTTSTYVDTFAHRRKGRVSDMTFVDPSDDDASAALTRSESRGSSLNDLSLTLNDDDDDTSHLTTLTKYKATSVHDNDRCAHDERHVKTDSLNSGLEDDLDDDDMATRIDRLMAATMEALEASNRLVLDTLSSRAKLAQLNAMEAALDSHLDAREAHLRRQIQAVTDMTDFVSKTSAELQKLTSPAAGLRVTSGAAPAGQITTLADSAELQVREAAATGIVQALDRDATIGKTAAKRLERMLQTPSPNASPSSAASTQRRNTQSSRRAFSISDFASKQSSIAEEGDENEESPRISGTTIEERRTNATATSSSSSTPLDSRTSTPQKKRSVSYDSRSPGAIKLMPKLAGSSTARAKGVSGLPSYSTSVGSKASANVGVVSTAAQSTLAALLAMPSADRTATTPTRTETPSDSSYFDSAVGESVSSVSPPTPGSMHAIHGVLATPWKAASDEGVDLDRTDASSSLERSARRTSTYSSALSPRASLSLSDRDRAQQLSSQLAELRAERVMWNSQQIGSAEISQTSNSTSASDARGGGALRALQRLNEMSAAKIGGQKATSFADAGASRNGASKRVSLGLGLPSFSGLRPSASRSASTNAPQESAATTASSAPTPLTEDKTAESVGPSATNDSAADASDVGSSSTLLGGGWRSWASWNSAPSAAAEDANPQK